MQFTTQNLLGSCSAVGSTYRTINGVNYNVKVYYYFQDNKVNCNIIVTDKFFDGKELFRCTTPEELEEYFNTLVNASVQ